MKTLLESDLININYAPKKGNYKDKTPLHLAAELGYTEIVNSLLNAGANFDLTTNDGLSALINAAMNGHAEVVNSLIVAGADINFAIKEGFYVGKTAIEAVATNPNINENKKQKIFIKLFEVGADLRPEFFKDDAISDNMKDFAREHNTPEKIAERDKNLQDIFKKSILAGQPISFRDNIFDKVVLKALRSITEKDLVASKENLDKLQESGVYPLLKIMTNLSDDEIILTAKNLKDFKAISDKISILNEGLQPSEKLIKDNGEDLASKLVESRTIKVFNDNIMSMILKKSLEELPKVFNEDLTSKLINNLLEMHLTSHDVGGKLEVNPAPLGPKSPAQASTTSPSTPPVQEQPSGSPAATTKSVGMSESSVKR